MKGDPQLHRAGCLQEDDRLLRQGCERSGSPERPDRSDATRIAGGRLVLIPGQMPWRLRFSVAVSRSSVAASGKGEDGLSADVTRHSRSATIS